MVSGIPFSEWRWKGTHLGEAAAGDTADYVAHRLQLAGGKQSLLSSDALAISHEATFGSLRDIVRIATEALKHAAKRKLKVVDRQLIQEVASAD